MKAYLQPLVSAAIMAALLIGYDHFARVKPAPYVPPIAAEARAYEDGLAGRFTSIADQVQAGTLTTSDQVAAAFAANSTKLRDAVTQAIKSNCDDKGKITNPAALAAEFKLAGQALGAK